MNNFGTVLPIHASFYGDIHTSDLAFNLARFQTALEGNGLRLIKRIDSGESLQELWGCGEVAATGRPPQVISTLTGKDADLMINWVVLIDKKLDQIDAAIAQAIALCRDA